MQFLTAVCLPVFVLLSSPIAFAEPAQPSALLIEATNEAAIAGVKSGDLTEANAAWWGFDESDSTTFLQAAIDSGAKKLIVPVMGKPWIVRPLTIPSNIEIVFEPGTVVQAKRGEFKGGGDSLFRATDQTDIKLMGYGATLRMWKQDYQSAEYKPAEWRMGVAIVGCKRVHIEGMRIEGSGGDGIYIGSSGQNRWCEDVVVRNAVCHENHRQGMSVISARNLLVENCIFSNTAGTPPEAGIDLEPDSPNECLVNITIRNCIFENNQGNAALVYIKPFTKESEPVSVLFENCLSRMTPDYVAVDGKGGEKRGWAGFAVGASNDNGPTGLIEFRDCSSSGTGREGAKVFDKSADGVLVRFVNCTWSDVWTSRFADWGGPRVPIFVHLRRPSITQKLGGIEFIDCKVFDNAFRPVIELDEDEGDYGVRDISGTITVHSVHAPRMKLGSNAENISLTLSRGRVAQ